MVSVRTTIHPQGLVIHVGRLFRQRVAAVDYDRLVLEPAEISGLRPGLLWAAGIVFLGALATTIPDVPVHVPPLVAATLFATAALLVLLAVVAPRRMTLFLDREQGLHPGFIRGGPDDEHVARFVDEVREAAIAWRCRPATEEPEAELEAPRLADTIDKLMAMRAEGLLSEAELSRFRDLAAR